MQRAFLALALLILVAPALGAADWNVNAVRIWKDRHGQWFANLPIQEPLPFDRPVVLGGEAPARAEVLGDDGEVVAEIPMGGVRFDSSGLSREESGYAFNEAMRRQRRGGRRTVGGTFDSRTGTYKDIYWKIPAIMATRFLSWRNDGAPGDQFEIDRNAQEHALEWLSEGRPDAGEGRSLTPRTRAFRDRLFGRNKQTRPGPSASRRGIRTLRSSP